jgi:hypothetical protein
MRIRSLAALLVAAVVWSLASPVSAATATITVVLGPSTTVGGRVSVSGVVTPHAATPQVVVQRLIDGAWSDRAAGPVNQANGHYRIVITPSQHDTYVLRVRSNGGSVVSPQVQLVVQPRPTTITASLSATSVTEGSPVQVRGKVIEPDALRNVVVQRLVAGRWSDRGTAVVDQRTGAFALTITPTQPGPYTLRVRSPGGTKVTAAMALDVRPRVRQIITYSVTTRGRVGADVGAFARHAAATYADRRGWSMGGTIQFRQVASGGSFTLVLAQSSQMSSFGPPCDSSWSCRSGRYVIINETRWQQGAPGWALSLDSYRHYVVNHETGHWLGQGHATCSGSGALAPVMMQQSKSTTPCKNTIWPLGWERDQVARRRGVPVF